MEELVALIFTFCISPTVVSTPDDTDTIVACQAYVTNCVVDLKSHWTDKELKRCEQEGLRRDWNTKQ